jgi:hypothetical protein
MSDILKIPPGRLNNLLAEDLSKETIDFDNESAQSILRRSAIRAFTPNVIRSAGPFYGIVLRVEANPDPNLPESMSNRINDWTAPPEPQPGTDATRPSSANQNTEKVSVPQLVVLKVRIPELHIALPTPEDISAPDLNPANLGDRDNWIIDLYPSYTAVDASVPVPNVGDIVIVDYRNRAAYADPIYIGPLNKEPSGNASAASPLGHPCGNVALQANQASGDPLAGGNQLSGHLGDVKLSLGKSAFAEPPPIMNKGLTLPVRKGPLNAADVRGLIPEGKGMWIMGCSKPQAKINRAKEAGLNFIMIQVHTSKKLFNNKNIKKLADLALQNGILVYVWGFPSADAVRYKGQVAHLITKAKECGCSGIITDPEAPFLPIAPYSATPETSANAAKILLTAAKKEGFSVGMSSYGALSEAPGSGGSGIRYKNLAPWFRMWGDKATDKGGLGPDDKGVDFVIPQVYGSQGAVSGMNPRNKSTYWEAHLAAWRDVFGERIKVIPSLGAYGKNFHDYADSKNEGTYPRGNWRSKGPQRMRDEFKMCPIPDNAICWWSWIHLDSRKKRWAVIKEFGAGQQNAPAPAQTAGAPAEGQKPSGAKTNSQKPTPTVSSVAPKKSPASTQAPKPSTVTPCPDSPSIGGSGGRAGNGRVSSGTVKGPGNKKSNIQPVTDWNTYFAYFKANAKWTAKNAPGGSLASLKGTHKGEKNILFRGQKKSVPFKVIRYDGTMAGFKKDDDSRGNDDRAGLFVNPLKGAGKPGVRPSNIARKMRGKPQGKVESFYRPSNKITHFSIHEYGANASFRMLMTVFKAKNLSSHFAIDKNGQIYQICDASLWVSHVGGKEHKTSTNSFSVGIDWLPSTGKATKPLGSKNQNKGALPGEPGRFYRRPGNFSQYWRQPLSYKIIPRATLEATYELIRALSKFTSITHKYAACDMQLDQAALRQSSVQAHGQIQTKGWRNDGMAYIYWAYGTNKPGAVLYKSYMLANPPKAEPKTASTKPSKGKNAKDPPMVLNQEGA